MSKRICLLIVVAASVVTSHAQSGRRVNNRVPIAPIQPSINAEPEIKPQPTAAPTEMFFLPGSFRERQIRMIEGGSFRFADFEGKVVVINLWASWCGPCRQEVPEYEKVRKSYAGQDVEFVGLTPEDPRTSAGNVRTFLRSVNFGFRLGWADRETAHTLMNGRRAIPQTLVIDGEGRIVDRWDRYASGRSGAKLKQTIDHALEVSH